MNSVIVNVNGQILADALTPSIPVFDRSYLYGDSLYEVVRTYRGKFLYMEEHLMRLAKSDELCRMRLTPSLAFHREE